MQNRPNILVITTDQQRWDALSFWGSPGYHTPNLDALAREGMIFKNAYTPAPVCTPARMSMITGHYSTRHFAYNIGVGPTPALEGPTFASVLSENGYHTALVGKTHFASGRGMKKPDPLPEIPSNPEALHSEATWLAFGRPEAGFDQVRTGTGHGFGKPSAAFRLWLERQGVDSDEFYPDNEAVRNSPWWLGGKWDLPHAYSKNAWVAAETLEIVDYAGRHDRNWCVMANFFDPHYPLTCSEPFYSDVDMAGVDLGGLKPGEYDNKPPIYRRFIEGHMWSDEDDDDFRDAWGVPDARRYDFVPDPEKGIRAYIGMVNQIDHYVGKMVEGLKERGLFENTLILFTCDHGEMLGRHGLWYKGIMSFDDNQRVPTLMRWPAAQRNGAIGQLPDHACFSLVDILPTVLEAAGCEAPDYHQGVSQLPVLRGETDSARDWALVDHLSNPPRLHQQTLVWDGWKIVVYMHADYGELYDMRADPDQYRNLWNDPAAADHRTKMLHKLTRVNMERVGKMPPRVNNA